MATEVVTVLRDDVDGSTAERTVRFSWDGVNYEIDLSKKNIAELGALLEPFIAAGRRTTGRGRSGGRAARSSRGAKSGSNRSGVDLAAVRTWAAANGHVVAERGRISVAVLDAFRANSAGATSVAGAAATKPAPSRATKRASTSRAKAAKA
jgi:hypothetical protein